MKDTHPNLNKPQCKEAQAKQLKCFVTLVLVKADQETELYSCFVFQTVLTREYAVYLEVLVKVYCLLKSGFLILSGQNPKCHHLNLEPFYLCVYPPKSRLWFDSIYRPKYLVESYYISSIFFQLKKIEQYDCKFLG